MEEGEIQRQTEEEERKREEEGKTLQLKKMQGNIPEVTPDLESRIRTLRGSGQPLPKSIRAFFESRFGYDFSHVRIHTDPEAAKLARTLNAEAFTYGRDIYFGEGKYNPGTLTGKKLLSHELTHTIQQKLMPTIQRQGPAPCSQTNTDINALFVSKMTWLTLKLRDMASDALDSLLLAHNETVSWGQEVAQLLLSSASAGIGTLIGGSAGSKLFKTILLNSSSSLLRSAIQTQNLNIEKFKTKVKDYINDYLLGPTYGVLARLKMAKDEEKKELNKVICLLNEKKVPQIKRIAQEIAMSVFLAGSKGVLYIHYRAYGPDLSKYYGDLSSTPLKWYNAPGRHIHFDVPILRSWWRSTGYTEGMTFLEKVYQGKKVRDAKIPNIIVTVGLIFPARAFLASKDYFHCYWYYKKGYSIQGCKSTGHMVHYSFHYFNGQAYSCSNSLCCLVKNIPQSVVDKNIIEKDSWYNYNLKTDVADKAIAFALNETLPKPRL